MTTGLYLPRRGLFAPPPSLARIDRSNPLSRGLVAVVDVGAATAPQVLGGPYTNTVQAGATLTVERGKRARKFPGSTTAAAIIIGGDNDFTDETMTLMAVLSANSAGGYISGKHRAFGHAGGWALDVNGTTGIRVETRDFNATTTSTTTLSINASAYPELAVVLTIDYAAARQAIFAGGLYQEGTTATNYIIGGANKWQIGDSMTTGDSTFSGVMYAVALWQGRSMTRGEMQALAENPWQIFEPRRPIIYSFASGGGGGSAALSGSSSTTSPGTLSPTSTVPVTGSSVSALAGTVTPLVETTVALTGAAASASAGSLASTRSVPVTGSVVTVSAGTVALASTKALTGSSSSAAAGTVTPALTAPLTGSGLTTSAGIVSPVQDGSVGLTGSSVTAASGTTTPVVTVALAGAAVGIAAGALTATRSATLAGSASSVSSGSLSKTASSALSGTTVTGSPGTLGITSQRSLTGQSVTASAGTISPSLNDTVVSLSGASVTSSAGSVTSQINLTPFGIEIAARAGTITTVGGDVISTSVRSTGGGGGGRKLWDELEEDITHEMEELVAGPSLPAVVRQEQELSLDTSPAERIITRRVRVRPAVEVQEYELRLRVAADSKVARNRRRARLLLLL